MSNGESEVASKVGKMQAISKNLTYLEEACKKNLNLSSEIRSKLLASEATKTSGEQKTPRESGQLNSIRDHLQDLLNYINSSNAHLVSVNKEV